MVVKLLPYSTLPNKKTKKPRFIPGRCFGFYLKGLATAFYEDKKRKDVDTPTPKKTTYQSTLRSFKKKYF